MTDLLVLIIPFIFGVIGCALSFRGGSTLLHICTALITLLMILKLMSPEMASSEFLGVYLFVAALIINRSFKKTEKKL